MQRKIIFSVGVIALLILSSCGGNKQNNDQKTDSTAIEVVLDSGSTDTVVQPDGDTTVVVVPPKEIPKVTIHLFHATRRCVSCIAIGDCVNAVLKESFSKETKAGTLKLIEVDAEDEKNAALCEKYEAFGTALFVTRTYKGQEKVTDFTGPGFKLAKNKPDEFKQQLKDQILKDLK